MGLLAFLKTQFVVHLLIGFVFVVSGLIINSIQLCTLVLWPVNKQLYRRLNCRLAYSLWSREYHPRVHGGGRGAADSQDGRLSAGWSQTNQCRAPGVNACGGETRRGGLALAPRQEPGAAPGQ